MPRTPHSAAPAPRPPRPATPPANSLLASAANLPTRLPAGTGTVSQEWQSAAWDYYDKIGELAYAAGWYANTLSRVTLTVRQRQADGSEIDVTEGLPADVLNQLYDGVAGQSQMLAAFGTHLFVPGECYLIGLTSDDTADPDSPRARERWGVFSTDEVSRKSGRWQVDRGDKRREVLTDDDLIIRIWRPHPRKWVLADSPCRAVLSNLQEILDLSSHIHATSQSRLAGAGVLLVPSEMTFDSPPTSDATGSTPDPTDPATDSFMEDLTDAMVTPIKDRGSAAAAVPFVIKAPGAILGNIKHLSFATPFDANVLALRDSAIRRLALGLDLPPEVLLGQADSNHWSAWQIEESALKIHIEPVLELVTAALTERFLWPVLEGQGYAPARARQYRIEADTSALRSRPNRSAEAFQLHDILAIDDDALLRETGFDAADQPTLDEQRQMLLRKLAVASTDPTMAAQALRFLGVDIESPDTTDPGSTGEDSTDSLPEVPESNGPPERPAQSEAAAAVQAACELLVGRAVERARNRVHHRGKTPRPMSPERLDDALRDAWADVPRVAALIGADPDKLTATLDRYTRAVLTEGVHHVQPQVMAKVLDTGVSNGAVP